MLTVSNVFKEKEDVFAGFLPNHLYKKLKNELDIHENQLQLFLFWMKFYPTYSLMELIFNIKKGTISTILNETLEKVFEWVKKQECFPHFRDSEFRKQHAIELEYPTEAGMQKVNVTGIVDGTEFRIEGTNDKEKGAAYWSGKKGDFSVQVQVLINLMCLVEGVSPMQGGRPNDINQYNAYQFAEKLSPGECILADQIYKSLSPLFNKKRADIVVPFSDKTEDPAEKKFNQIACAIRLTIEDLFGMLKSLWRILHDRFRGRNMINEGTMVKLERLFLIACSFHNFGVLGKLAKGELPDMAKTQEWATNHQEKGGGYFMKGNKSTYYANNNMGNNK